MTVGDPRIVALVAHARRVPLADRERFSRRLAATEQRTVVLETCHRVEAYTVVREETELLTRLPPGGEVLEGEAAAQHAISVAVGLDSVVIGEDQILHQLRTSITVARREQVLDPTLDRLFTLALRAGRRARSWRQDPAPSLADAAVAAIERRIGALRGRRFLIVGAGEMARLATEAATGRGAMVTIASRTPERADGLARTIGARTAPFDPGPGLTDFAGVLVALKGPWPIADSSTEALAAGRAAVVDLSVPSAVPDDLPRRLDGRFVSADDLAATEPAPPSNDRLRSRLNDLVATTLDEFRAWVDARSRRAAAAALAERADSERRAELDELFHRLPGLEPEARAAIEAMSEHLTGRLLREPLERMGRDVDGRAERAARELFAL
jgi:glutamyl-tRNA reductase